MAQDLKKLGDKYFKNKELEKAISEYTKAIKLDELDYSFYSNRAACYMTMGRFKESLNDAEKVIEIKPNFAKGYSRKAHALAEMGKKKEALEVYKLGLEKTGDMTLEKNYRQMMQSMGHGILPKEALSHALMNPEILGWYTSNQKFKDKVDSLVNEIPSQSNLQSILRDSKMMKFFNYAGLLGKSKNEKKNFSKINTSKESKFEPLLTVEQKEEKKKKDEADTIKNEGTRFYKNKDYETALEYYERATKIFPEEPTYILNQAAVYMMQNNLDKCEEICQKVINISRENQADYKWPAKAYTRLATIEEKRGNLEKAIKYLLESLTEIGDEKIRERLKQLKKKIKITKRNRSLKS